jgi:cellulose synthase/poly-beta-1,6-N-acetylglucosamine synthase-like glycosyltransferase
MILDADNLLARNFMTKMNDAFDNKGYDAFSSYVHAKNYGTNIFSSHESQATLQGHYNARALGVLGIGAANFGKGFMMRNNLIAKTGWEWCGFVEDTEFSYDIYSRGVRTTYVEEACLYDENPLSFKVCLRQKIRTNRGEYIAYLKYFLFLIVGIFLPYDFDKKFYRPDRVKHKNIFRRILVEIQKRWTCFDYLVRKFPSVAIYPVTIMIYIIISVINYFLTNTPLIEPVAIILYRYYYAMAVGTWCGLALTAIREYKKIRITPIKFSIYFMLWPIVRGTEQFITKIAALFWPVKWKRIPHIIDKKVEEINDIPGLIE